MNRKVSNLNIPKSHKIADKCLFIIAKYSEPLMTYLYSRTSMSNYVPTHYRTHTLGEIQANGADLIDSEVTVAGFMEANRGKGQYVLLICEMVPARPKSSSKPTMSERNLWTWYKE